MHILSTIRPTQHQLQVLAILAANQDHPALAATKISNDANLVSARKMLQKLGVVSYNDSGATLTDKGQQLAKDQNITDESGQLTDEGNKLVNPEQQTPTQAQPSVPNPDMGMGGEPPIDFNDLGDEDFTPEGFSELFKNIISG